MIALTDMSCSIWFNNQKYITRFLRNLTYFDIEQDFMRAIAICQGPFLQFVISDTSILTTLGFPCFDIENDLCLCYTFNFPCSLIRIYDKADCMLEKHPPLSKENFEAIAKQYPTPFHIYDEKAILTQARALKQAFSWNRNFKEYFV